MPTYPVAMGIDALILLGCWATLALQVAWALRAAGSWGPERRRVAQIALGMTAAAIALRWGLAPATPEMRWRMGFSYDDLAVWEIPWATRPPQGTEDAQKYGLGWPMIVRVAVGLLGRDAAVPFWINPVIGGLCVVPMMGLVRAVGGSVASAAWAGFALAVTPLLVWFGHTDGPFPSDALFSLLTLWATARYATSHDPRWLVTATCAVVSAAQMRIESATTGVAAVLLAVALYDRFPWRRPAPYVAAVAATALLVPHAFPVHDQLLLELRERYGAEQGEALGLSVYSFLFTNPTMQSLALIVATPLGLAFGPVSWRVRAWAALVMVAAAQTVPGVVPLETAFSVARYQLRALPYAALLAGLGASWLSAAPRRRWGAALFAVAAVAELPRASTVSVMKTEYDFFVAHLDEIPEPCTILTWRSQGDTTLFVPLHLSRLEGRAHTWLDIARDPVPPTGCVLYYRSSGCAQHYREGAAGDVHPACAAFESAWALRPIAEAALPADPYGPMGFANQRPGRSIPVGFFEVVGPAAP
jgi:hypothetical protein